MRACLLVLITCVTTCSWARLDAYATGSTLYVNKAAIHTFKTAYGEVTPEKRARLAAEAVASAFGLKVYSGVDSGLGRVSIGERKILTVGADEAKAQGKSVHELTQEVAARLQDALKEVSFAVSTRQVWIPVGGEAELALIGPRAGEVKTRTVTPGVANAVRTGNRIAVTAVGQGSTVLSLRVGDETEEVAVNVLPYAATIGAPDTAIVVGRPADKLSVENAVVRAVRSAMSADPTAEVIIEVAPVELVPMQRSLVRAKVTVRAPYRYPVEKELEVETKNVGPLDERAEELWYSNDPEVLRRPGPLYWGRLTEGKAARVLYHHQNMSGRPLELEYVLVNTSDLPASIGVMPGDATPHLNPTFAGYMAGQEFFPRWVSGSASVVEVPPHSAVPIVVVGMKPRQTASGLMALHHMSGSHVLLIGTCRAAPIEGLSQSNVAHTRPSKSLADSAINLAGAPQHVYSPAEKSLTTEYAVGGRFGYVRIGQVPVERIDDAGALSGNFGIVYKIQAELSNPTDKPAEIEFVYEASAGYGGAYFRINGSVFKTPLLQPKQSFRLHKVLLQPGEKKTYYMETIPLSGASYPVTLTIKAVGVG